MNKSRLMTTSGLVLGLVLLIGVNLLSTTAITPARVDLTENQLYTLSDGSRSLLRSLDEPVTLRLFLSRELLTRLPGIVTYAQRVEELLEQFDRVGGEKLRFETVDPEPFSEQEDRAVALGLEGVPLGDGESLFYFGLVASGPTDVEEVIAFFSIAREEFLEYDLARLVYQVAHPEPPVVGILSSLPMRGGPGGAMMGGMGAMSPPWAMLGQVEQFFEVRHLAVDVDRIADDIGVLMVVGPGRLPPASLYAVDQFVLSGGRVVVFADPHAESDPASTMPGMAAAGGYAFDALFDAWGLALRPGAVAADMNLAHRVRTRSNERNVVIDYPVWLNLRPELYDDTDVITADLGDALMASAGVLDVMEREGVTVTPLIRTTEAAAVIDPSRLGPGADLAELVRNYEPGGERLMLAARVSGRFSTAFPAGRPASATTASSGDDAAGDAVAGVGTNDADAPVADTPPHRSESAAPAEIVVFADTDMLRDHFWVTTQNLLGTQLQIPTSANNSLVVNALQNLAGDENLISIRSRGGHTRPFTLLDDVRRQAERRYLQKEQELLDELDRTEQRLTELQASRTQDQGTILTPDQEAEIERFREQKVRIRTELREVQRNLREDIERIHSWIKFVNIGLVPLFVGIGGILFAATRHARGRRRDA